MMENHGYGQVIGNPNAPWINAYAKYANLATNYFAVAHPSLTNYLEVVGGSNFGILSDNSPDWHNAGCTSNIVSDASIIANQNRDDNGAGAICPISGTGNDAATPRSDFTNEGPPFPLNNIDGIKSIPSAVTPANPLPINWPPTTRAGKPIRKTSRSVARTTSTTATGRFPI